MCNISLPMYCYLDGKEKKHFLNLNLIDFSSFFLPLYIFLKIRQLFGYQIYQTKLLFKMNKMYMSIIGSTFPKKESSQYRQSSWNLPSSTLVILVEYNGKTYPLKFRSKNQNYQHIISKLLI